MCKCLQDCFRIYTFALVIQIGLCIGYLTTYRLKHPHTPVQDVIKRVCEVIIHAAPPGIPTVMIFCGGSSRGRLQRQGVTMHAVDLLKSSGEVEVACFDKTGTLTGSTVSVCHCWSCRLLDCLRRQDNVWLLQRVHAGPSWAHDPMNAPWSRVMVHTWCNKPFDRNQCDQNQATVSQVSACKAAALMTRAQVTHCILNIKQKLAR